MNFDNLKSNYQSLSYGGGDDNTVDFTKKIGDLVERVRTEDQKDKQRIIGVSILAAGFGLVYGIVGLLKYLENKEGSDHWGYLLYVLAIISFVPILVREYQRNRRINYDVSLIQFIENVEKRFALLQPKDIWLIPGFFILSISMAFMVSKSAVLTIETILIGLAIIIFAATVGFITRLIVWRKKLLLREELRRIKESLK